MKNAAFNFPDDVPWGEKKRETFPLEDELLDGLACTLRLIDIVPLGALTSFECVSRKMILSLSA